MTTALTEWARTQNGKDTLRAMPTMATPYLMLDWISDAFSPEEYDMAKEELDALPNSFLAQMVMLWRDADDAGKSFEIRSEAPEKPIDSARNGRVEWRMVYDEAGTKMIVSHVHNHHASWLTSQTLASVT